jgi:hypothetical protein
MQNPATNGEMICSKIAGTRNLLGAPRAVDRGVRDPNILSYLKSKSFMGERTGSNLGQRAGPVERESYFRAAYRI